MSNSRSSTPDISEEHDEGNDTHEVSEEHDEGDNQEIGEERHEGNAEETGEEHDEGDNQEIGEERHEGNTEETGEEHDEGDTQETGEEQDEGNKQEISEERDEDNTQEVSEDEGNNPEISEEQVEDNTREVSGEQAEVDTQEIRKGDKEDRPKKPKDIKKATVDHAKEIFEKLKSDDVPKIILTGQAGTGKTWIAKKISELAVKEKHDEPIWICLDKKNDGESLKDTIARQFSLPTSTDKREEDGELDEKKEKQEKSLEDKIKEKMKEKLKHAQKFLLMILDGQLEKMIEKNEKEETEVKIDNNEKEDDMEVKIKKILGLNDEGKFKILITKRESEDGDSSEELKEFEIIPLSGSEAVELLDKNVDKKLKDSYDRGFQGLCKAIRDKGDALPAEILMLAGTLNYIAKYNSPDLERAMEAATNNRVLLPDKEPNNLIKLLRHTYDKEPGNGMIKCFWHSWHFLRKHGGVHYNELITNWIMEGYLTPTNQIDKAYEKGFHVLMELIDCHLLKMEEDNIVFVEGATLNLKEHCRLGYTGEADPGFTSVLKECNWNVLEGITPADGMMKTLCGDKKGKMISSLLIDGGRLCREVHDSFFGTKENLSLLAIFNPRLKSPDELSISSNEKLHVLLLRGSYLLGNVNHIINFKELNVLEVSGASDLKEIPPEFFSQVSKLRSLDLSGAGIELLPDSFSELTELRRLILRRCSSLKELPKLEKFSKLEVIDLSESTSLEKIKEKSFNSLQGLKVINFSKTKIEKLPIVKTLKNLTILLLQGCRQLSGMRRVKQVSTLKILDLSGAENIKEIFYDCFEETEGLTELDLSGTQIQYLPPHIGKGKLQKLRLNRCSLLRSLPELKEQTSLEELELSGCEKLDKLPDLAALSNLKKLNLCATALWSQSLDESLSHITGLQILK